MKVLKPSAISAEIIDLIELAQIEIVIISPYNEITNWKKLIKRINQALSRGVNIIWYSRKGTKQKYPDEVSTIFKIQPIFLENLHAKIYLNEKTAVITSMNLCESSDINSIDIGLISESQEEYQNIYNYYETYIKVPQPIEKPKELKTKRNLTLSQLLKIPENISNKNYVNEINAHIIKEYGKFETCDTPPDSLRYLKFQKLDYLELQFFTKAIKIIVGLSDIKRFEDGNVFQWYIKHFNLADEFELNRQEKYVKYYYQSSTKLDEWKSRQLECFLNEFDIVIQKVIHI